MIKTWKLASVSTLLILSFGLVFQAYAQFGDVSAQHANAEAIGYVEDQGIVKGYPDGTYRANQTINRAEFTKILVETRFKSEAMSDCEIDGYPDVKAGVWFEKYVCIAQKHNIARGFPDGTFKPEKSVNFAEAAKMISNTFQLSQNGAENPWYKPFVESLELRKAIPISIKRFDHAITRGEMAEIIWRLETDNRSKNTQTYMGLD